MWRVLAVLLVAHATPARAESSVKVTLTEEAETLAGENGPSALTVHALGGIALHTEHVRVFAQGALAPGETAVSLGVRGAF